MSKTVTTSAALALTIVLAMPWQATAERSAHDTPAAAERIWTGYREAGDQAYVAPQDVASIYETALRFYLPPRNQYRRLDLVMLPAAPGDTVRALDRTLAEILVGRLGTRFALTPRPIGPSELGADLRVSEIYAISPDRVRVVVACRLVWPGGATTDNTAQAFEIVRGAKGWKIADRGGVETPD